MKQTLSTLVAAVLSIAVITSSCAKPLNPPKHSQTKDATGIPDYSGETVGALPVPSAVNAPDGTYTHPYPISFDNFQEVDLPEFWQKNPFDILNELSDGKLVLQCRSRISIYDPNAGEEKILV